eukprot:4198626-Ditylum_brightwellii.AAC.1
MSFPATMKLLKVPDVWVRDTGVSCDSTGSYISMVNRKILLSSDGVTMPNNDVRGMTMIVVVQCASIWITKGEQKVQQAFKYMKYKCNKANLFLSVNCMNGFLVLWIAWVDDCLNAELPDSVCQAKKETLLMFDCEDLGLMKEYVGCKINYNTKE